MLYVGILERPFTWLKYGTLAGIGVVFFAVMIGAAWVSLRWARTIFAPVERMDQTMQRVEGGALDARVGEVASDDEIGRLAGHLDRLLATLQRWHFELDAKVAERTRELQETQAQLVRSDRLATVGQLTASIAHEVNNPIAVIQGNLDLARQLLDPAAAARVAPELKLVDEQIQRMRLIVAQLLQFARPNEFAGYVETLAPATALEDGLLLVAHLLARSQITLRRDYRATRETPVNRHELQQVLVNLLVNAVDAMPDGGTLTLSTEDTPDGGVALHVADSGPGLPPELLSQLFRPFVTRKKDGTGLGLWISRGIVERYGGDLVARNADGGGAVFTVRLRAAS
jgi:C4-dicarboxylate-specific signal transduction histidine kinase